VSNDITGQYILVVIAIILASGSLGGLVNYYLARLESPHQLNLKESLVIGIAASFLVPLFLQMISSDLLRRGASDHLVLFVFAGFCLIAAISSKAFIRTLSEQVLKEARAAKAEAQEARQEASYARAAASEARQEVEVLEEDIEQVVVQPTPQISTSDLENAPISDPEKAVLRAVYSNPKPRPNFEDIPALGHWRPEELSKTLQELEKRGLVRSKMYEDGQTRWRVRTAGKALVGQFQASPTEAKTH
jgi:DNA-binding MarR family transcriptional regulator